jgi:hypothetical protein
MHLSHRTSYIVNITVGFDDLKLNQISLRFFDKNQKILSKFSLYAAGGENWELQ